MSFSLSSPESKRQRTLTAHKATIGDLVEALLALACSFLTLPEHSSFAQVHTSFRKAASRTSSWGAWPKVIDMGMPHSDSYAVDVQRAVDKMGFRFQQFVQTSLSWWTLPPACVAGVTRLDAPMQALLPPPDDDDDEVLPFSKVEVLHLYHTQGEEGESYLSILRKLPAVDTLYVHAYIDLNPAVEFKGLNNRLRRLGVWGGYPPDYDDPRALDSELCRGLTMMNLEEVALGDTALLAACSPETWSVLAPLLVAFEIPLAWSVTRACSAVNACTKLRSVRRGFNTAWSASAIAQLLASVPHREMVELSLGASCTFQDLFTPSLVALVPRLEHVTFTTSATGLSDMSKATLPPSLRTVTMRQTPVVDFPADRRVAVALDGCPVGGGGVQYSRISRALQCEAEMKYWWRGTASL